METSQEKQTLIQKLAEACNEVGGVAKLGKNPQQGYSYVKAADVAKAIRHELFKRGIVILASETSCEHSEFATKAGGVMREVRLTVQYTITDGDTSYISQAYGVAFDSGDKAIYKAKTAALKYFLRGLGLIPDELEPEIDSPDEKKWEAAQDEFNQEVAPTRPPMPIAKPNGQIPVCVKCGSHKIQPAGISKQGKPYGAFCRDCHTKVGVSKSAVQEPLLDADEIPVPF